MATVTTWSVDLDDVLALFSGSDAVAATLLGLAAAAWPPPPKPAHVGNLDRLGPFSRHPVGGAPVVRPGVPTRGDVTDLVHRRPIAPGRVSAAWALVELWLDHVATAHAVREATDADDGPGGGLGEPVELPLPPLAGQQVGYTDGVLTIRRLSRSPR
ncbi:hypothetical protein PCC79_02830 [Propioniciclava soli]|uniref:Uncharacterized protein n=1 Tax=Propioniciclava soli TaxID=2775081 RepID=A0ABZ3C8S4_9ACTN